MFPLSFTLCFPFLLWPFAFALFIDIVTIKFTSPHLLCPPFALFFCLSLSLHFYFICLLNLTLRNSVSFPCTNPLFLVGGCSVPSVLSLVSLSLAYLKYSIRDSTIKQRVTSATWRRDTLGPGHI